MDDVPGLVIARTVAALVNNATHLLARRTACSAYIDTAMRLGTNYPLGQLDWRIR
ncbi:3-hydroxyacyl-CoA dehydrogenase family protein [Nocardia nepalensis]|uniref:3-hydroxyacyl-CoA dehydrogenase family protein n=1 Tax=Nocardia nepalensis TaxID=3375448 RepID=UPI003B66C9A5